MRFETQVEGLEELDERWAQAVTELQAKLPTMALMAARAGMKEAEPSVPVRAIGGGALRASAKVVAGPASAWEATAIMHWDKDYASFVDTGARPHAIYPIKQGGWLRWEDPVWGWVARKFVLNHPGVSKPFFFSAKAAEFAMDALSVRAEREAIAAARRLNL